VYLSAPKIDIYDLGAKRKKVFFNLLKNLPKNYQNLYDKLLFILLIYMAQLYEKN
jgi:hypothetical protein